jgi:hypothetical protein
LTRVTLLTEGGLTAEYYDNQWLYGAPTIKQIDSTISYAWSTGRVATLSSDFASIRWRGKLMLERSEDITFYLKADDYALLYLNHSLIINASEPCCIERRASRYLESHVFYDLVLEYVELTGTASVSLSYSSTTIQKQVIPSTRFFYATDILGSPFHTTVVPGAVSYPFTTAFGTATTYAVAGVPSYFFIQTKDSLGNSHDDN